MAMNFNRKSFSESEYGLQVAWDSTSLGLLKECPQKYFLKMVEGWQSKEEKVDLVFGMYYHAILEEFDHEMVESGSHKKAMRRSVRKALELTWHDGKPWEPEHPNKNRITLVRSIIWYIEEFKKDYVKPLKLSTGKAAVELSFRMDLDLVAPDGTPYLICGHLDKVGTLGEDAWVLDRKTTKGTLSASYFKQYSPCNQMSLYSMSSKIVLDIPAKGVIIDAAQIAVSFTRFQRGFTHRTSAQNTEYYNDTLQWIKIGEMYAERGHWPKNDKACHHYGGCEFREVCSKTPAIRKAYLETEFTRNDPWDPMKSR